MQLTRGEACLLCFFLKLTLQTTDIKNEWSNWTVWESIYLMDNSNVNEKINHMNGTFVGYKWTNITMSEMNQFLTILLKMPLICSYIDGFNSLWYPLTHATISPTCQFNIKDYPWCTQLCTSYCRFFQICAAFHTKIWTSNEGKNVIC